MVNAGYEVLIKPHELCRDNIDAKILDTYMFRKRLKTSELCRELNLPYDSRNRMLVIGSSSSVKATRTGRSGFSTRKSSKLPKLRRREFSKRERLERGSQCMHAGGQFILPSSVSLRS